MLDFSGAPRQDGERGRGDPGRTKKGPPDVEFMQAMVGHGLNPGGIVPGGLERFDVEKRGDKAGWYVFFDDGKCPAGSFGNWQTGLKKTWSYKSESEMSRAEIDIFRRHVAEMKEKRRQEEEKRHAEAKIKAEKIWNEAEPAPADHPYLVKKGVPSHGLKVVKDGRLVVPLFDIFNDIHSLQLISPEGKKKFLPGGAIKGNHFTIHGNDKVFVCEGFATGADIHAATGGTVVVAFNSGNLKPVALDIKSKFSSNQIIVCADNDTETDLPDGRKNPGVIYGTEAAKAIGAKLVVPAFKKPEGKATSDFNDLKRAEGLDAVKLQIMGAPKRFHLSDWSLDAYEGDPPKRIWLVRHTFPLASVGILAAMGDAGKGMLALDLGVKVASNPEGFDFNNGAMEAFGNNIEEHGTVVIFSAEDDKDEIHRRLHSIDIGLNRKDPVCKKRLIIIPLPNAGGPVPLVTPGRNGPEASTLFFEVRDQLRELDDLKLIIFDPMTSFVAADINADPAVGAFTTGLLSSLATETGALVLICHHMAKGNADRNVKTPEQARNMIRGTSAIVDGVRAAYVLWPMAYSKARHQCNLLKIEFQRNRVFLGALVKSNGPGDREVKIFVRNEFGLLVPNDKQLASVTMTHDEMLAELTMEIQDAAEAGQPFQHTGKQGVYERSEEFRNVQLREMSRDPLQDLVKKLLNEGEVLKCVAPGSKAKQWLDVPGGPFSLGIGQIQIGARNTKKEGMENG